MRYPNPDMLVYIGMADAYAAACEYIKLPRDAKVLSEDSVSPRGCYSGC